MAIEFVCPACGGTLRVADGAAGQVVRCGNCQAALRVPVPPPAEAFGPIPTAAEPRPRRRRPPPPPPPPRPSGRHVLRWALGGCVLLALVCGGACGGLLVVFQPNWKEHKSEAGGFAAEFPAEPRSDMAELARAKPQPDVRVEGTILVSKLEEYAVVYADIDPEVRRTATDAAILDEAVKAIPRDAPGGQVVRDAPATVSGFPAREVVLVHPEAGTFVCRVVVADTRLYAVTAGGPFVTADGNARTRRFLDSFRVTDPKLLAARGKNPGGMADRLRELWAEAGKKADADRRAADDAAADERARVTAAGRAVGAAVLPAIEAARPAAPEVAPMPRPAR